MHLKRDVVIVGCGSVLCGDGAAGSSLVHRMWDLGCPSSVHLVDGGTAGLDTAFQTADARHVFIVDTCATGAAPGTLFELRGEDVEARHLASIDFRAFRWDSAIAIARLLLNDRCPPRVTVLLIEAASLEYGAPLSAPVEARVDQLARDLIVRFSPATLHA